MARMLMTEDPFLRCQWKVDMADKTADVSSNVGTLAGERRLERRTTSLNATVMPPPVRGCRMFMASPRMMSPACLCVEGGRKLFGIERSLPASIALRKAGWTHSGSWGSATLSMWFLTPPFLGLAEGRFSGMSTRMRVSWVPIW